MLSWRWAGVSVSVARQPGWVGCVIPGWHATVPAFPKLGHQATVWWQVSSSGPLSTSPLWHSPASSSPPASPSPPRLPASRTPPTSLSTATSVWRRTGPAPTWSAWCVLVCTGHSTVVFCTAVQVGVDSAATSELYKVRCDQAWNISVKLDKKKANALFAEHYISDQVTFL